MVFEVAGRQLSFRQGDITEVAADAIVNAANSGLHGGGGVDGAIHRSGGPSIMQELDAIREQIGRCPTGQAVVTGAGDLPADWVIHAVGPVYRDGASGEADLLASCYRAALGLAQERKAARVSLPSISTGVYGYPLQEAAKIAVAAVLESLREPECSLERVTFVLFGEKAYQEHVGAAESLLQ